MATKKLTIKKLPITGKVFKKYQDLFNEKGEMPAKVTLDAQASLVNVLIDGEKVGVAEGMSPADIPALYDITITSYGDKTAEAELKTGEREATAASGNDPFSGIISAAMQNSGMTEEEIRNRIKVMQDNNVPQIVIEDVVARYRNIPRRHTPSVIYKDTGKHEMTDALANAMVGRAVIFEGPKSTGKNVLMENLAYVLAEPYYRKNMDLRAVADDLFGSKGTDNSAAEELRLHPEYADSYVAYMKGDDTLRDEAAKFVSLQAQSACIRLVFEPSEFVRWVRDGGVMNCDEINFWPTDIVQYLNSVADNEKMISNVNTGTMHLNDACYLFAGMNPGYAGTVELNEATASRFSTIVLDYPESIESQLKANFKRGEVPAEYFKVCNTIFKDFRHMVSQQRISDKCINIRGIVAAIRIAARYQGVMKLSDQLVNCVVNGCDPDEKAILRTLIYDKVKY